MALNNNSQKSLRLELPQSDQVIAVRVIDTTTNMTCPTALFLEPGISGHELLNMPTLAFLLEHKSNGAKVLFDCGSKKDYWNLPPNVAKALLKASTGLRVDLNIDEILERGGTDTGAVQTIIWSHWHWDHTGDISKFPPSTELVVGPGFKNNFLPGYPLNPDGLLLQENFAGRKIREIKFEQGSRIGRFESYDFFNDSSLFLLNIPGHAIGHMGALIRTTPDTYVFLGGDVCHFGGAIRPNAQNTLPAMITAAAGLDNGLPRPCPCQIFTACHPDQEHASMKPFYSLNSGKLGARSLNSDPEEAQQSVAKLIEYDAYENVFILLAHDGDLLKILPLFNNDPHSSVSDWYESGYRERSLWRFLNELPRDGKPGRLPLVEGCWRDGQLIKKA